MRILVLWFVNFKMADKPKKFLFFIFIFVWHILTFGGKLTAFSTNVQSKHHLSILYVFCKPKEQHAFEKLLKIICPKLLWPVQTPWFQFRTTICISCYIARQRITQRYRASRLLLFVLKFLTLQPRAKNLRASEVTPDTSHALQIGTRDLRYNTLFRSKSAVT